MARVTDKVLKKLRDNIKFKGTIVRGGVKWKSGDRKAKRTTKAWKAVLGDKLSEK